MSNIIQFTVKAKDLTGGALKSVDSGLLRMQKGVKGVVGQLFSLKGLIAGAGVGLLAKSFVDAANTTEQLGIRLNVMLGSAKEGNKVFQDMTKFASEVPFEYEEIMNSATMLAGIMKGGADEIREWMPLIGDLAATTGLTIQETTEQVQRMLGGGAAAADKFRERGVLAMLGFEQGVSVSADETKKKLLEAWEDPLSRFKGATAKLASSWSGTLSMIADKAFAMKTVIMDAGLFDFFKAVARTIDQYMGTALDNSKENGKAWAETIINGAFGIIDVIAKAIDTFSYLKIAWAGLKVSFAVMAEFIVTKLRDIGVAVTDIVNLIPGVDITPFKELDQVVDDLSGRTKGFLKELDALVNAPMPSDNIIAFKNSVLANLAIVTAETKKAKEEISSGIGIAAQPGQQFDWDKYTDGAEDAYEKANVAFAKSLLTQKEMLNIDYEQRLVELENFYLTTGQSDIDYYAAKKSIDEEYNQSLLDLNKQTAVDYNQIWSDAQSTFAKGVGDSVADAIVEGKSLGESMENVMKGVARQVISTLTQIGVNMLIQRQTQAAALALTAGTVSATAAGIAAASAPAAAMTSLMSFGANSAPAIAGMTAATTAAKGLALFSQAHSGITNVSKDATFEIQAGERVIKRDQNRDLTNFLSRGDTRANNSGGDITVEHMSVHMFENATNAEAFLELDESQMRQMVEEKILPAFDALKEQGIGFLESERTS